VKRDHGPPAEGVARFPTTHWTLVLKAAQSQVQGGPSALAELCRIYWYPLYAFVRHRGYGPDDARDLTQGFFLHLLNHRALRQVSPLKGKFRSFLVASLQNYLLDEADSACRLKRGGEVDFVPLDAANAEERYRLEPLDCLTAETIFDARWAMILMEEAMSRLYTGYAAQGKVATLETLKPFLDPLDGPESSSYEQAANQLQVSISAVKTLIHRARKQYRALLREEVARTVGDPQEGRGIPDRRRTLCK
jgi:RNA polymerase sigma factor (sigma-70 family)